MLNDHLTPTPNNSLAFYYRLHSTGTKLSFQPNNPRKIKSKIKKEKENNLTVVFRCSSKVTQKPSRRASLTDQRRRRWRGRRSSPSSNLIETVRSVQTFVLLLLLMRNRGRWRAVDLAGCLRCDRRRIAGETIRRSESGGVEFAVGCSDDGIDGRWEKRIGCGAVPGQTRWAHGFLGVGRWGGRVHVIGWKRKTRAF